MKFTDLDLHPTVLAGVEALNFQECTPIQEAAIPAILNGKDVAGLAQTGTGKTAAYLIPLMDRILRSREPVEAMAEEAKVRRFERWSAGNFILILVPTRELAEQVRENVKSIGAPGRFSSVAVYGGMSYEPQKKAINRGVHFVIATPGRLIDLYKDHVVDLNQVRAVVFDEADRMFDMGFKDDMKYLLKRIPTDRQFLVFSATLNFDVLNVAYEFGSHPVELNVSKDQAKAENVVDVLFHLGENDKPQHLLSILKKHQPRQAIVFSNFKNQVERIAQFLTANDVPSLGISSLLTQAQRNRVMTQFKKEGNDRNILVATDVAARGLDIKGVDMVINYELPDDPENYIHRIGRTGRAGEQGQAFSLVSDRDVEALSRIEVFIGHKVELGWLDDGDLIKEFKTISYSYSEKKPSFSRDRERERGRDRGRDRKRKPRRSEGERHQEPRASVANGRHRDRVTGRHKEDRAPMGTSAKSNNFKSQHFKHKKRSGKAYRHKPRTERFDPVNNPIRNKSASSTLSSSGSMGQKVARFFKKLFS